VRATTSDATQAPAADGAAVADDIDVEFV